MSQARYKRGLILMVYHCRIHLGISNLQCKHKYLCFHLYCLMLANSIHLLDKIHKLLNQLKHKDQYHTFLV